MVLQRMVFIVPPLKAGMVHENPFSLEFSPDTPDNSALEYGKIVALSDFTSPASASLKNESGKVRVDE